MAASVTADSRAVPASRRMSSVHALALALVWATFAMSGIVFVEPAPVDAMLFGLLLVLPVLGLIRVTPPLMLYLTIWLVAGAAALIGTINAADRSVALTHASVTLFLTLTSFIVSAFVMRRPFRHVTLIFQGYVFAASIAALAALSGYFRLFPGAYELFTRFDRASGTFKDPNVFGAFLVPAVVFLLHRMLTRGGLRLLWAALWAGIIGLAVLFSFSRGAWINLGVSVSLFAFVSFLAAPTNLQRVKILGAGVTAIVGALMLLGVALQIPGVSDQLASRATMDQTYDQGPEGRFGGQQKAMRVILDHPFGIGPQNFAPQFHMEEPHNVYLFSFLNAGWLGGLIFVIMIAATIVYGLRHAFKRTSTQPLFIIALACFGAHVGEGMIIDLDHWRHFHLLMALVWGMMLGDRVIVPSSLQRSAVAVDQVLRQRWASLAAASLEPDRVAPRRAARVLEPSAYCKVENTTEARNVATPTDTTRRGAGRSDSRPSRAFGRSFARPLPL